MAYGSLWEGSHPARQIQTAAHRSKVCHKHLVYWIPNVLMAVCPTFVARHSNRPQVSPNRLLRAPLQWQFSCVL